MNPISQQPRSPRPFTKSTRPSDILPPVLTRSMNRMSQRIRVQDSQHQQAPQEPTLIPNPSPLSALTTIPPPPNNKTWIHSMTIPLPICRLNPPPHHSSLWTYPSQPQPPSIPYFDVMHSSTHRGPLSCSIAACIAA